MYTSIFTVQSIPMAIKYYNIFKQLKEEGQHDLNVSTIFTYAANEDKRNKSIMFIQKRHYNTLS